MSEHRQNVNMAQATKYETYTILATKRDCCFLASHGLSLPSLWLRFMKIHIHRIIPAFFFFFF